MKTEYITLKETALTNNCPECYSTEGMVLSFKQEKLKSKLIVKTKKNVIESIECTKCETKIYPGQWTMDIERVHEYHKKTISAAPSSIKFTALFYVLLLVILLLAGFAYTYVYHPDIMGV